MDAEKIVRKVSVISIVFVVLFLVWFLILSPIITFKSNEDKMMKASKRYFEVNSNELPTGRRVKTISLKHLYSKAFLKEDMNVPLTNKSCSVTNSWAKVKRVDGRYKYYIYLECGFMRSMVDHKGPEITLFGNDVVTVNKGSKYNELGVKSVSDNSDGRISPNEVVINSKTVNTKKVGTYEVTYTAYDSLNNKTVKVRKVKVVSRIKNVVKKNTDKLGYYKGDNPNNYIYFSGMLFRIIGTDGTNVKIIADQDVSNVNYDSIDKWLEYYYDHLDNKSKKYIVEDNYCNMKLSDTNTDTTRCSSTTEKKKVYILSANELNKSLVDGNSFLKPVTISWLANKKDDKESYATRNAFYEEDYGKDMLAFDKNYNYGVRPVITIKGSSLVKKGLGTYESPYYLGDVKKAKTNTKLNKRKTGEYFEYANYLWRIIETDNDGTTKVIMDNTVKGDELNVLTFYKTKDKAKIYNPNQRGNVGYFIKNKMSRYLKTDYFVKKDIEVPIYKNSIKYKKEMETKKYKVKLFAPNMYDMFSAFVYNQRDGATMGSYWLINSSKKQYKKALITDIGYITNEDMYDFHEFGIRLCGYMNSDIKVVSGEGTKNNPYKITK
ncbi:MAG: DUF5011 domain-containing protein [Bacilli bacterium]|nr:DUF5011 domain-containing protein [Bacilli bacterium]MBR3049723.1 DUF5011 domain-containing protein [Bacilli bacterium]